MRQGSRASVTAEGKFAVAVDYPIKSGRYKAADGCQAENYPWQPV